MHRRNFFAALTATVLGWVGWKTAWVRAAIAHWQEHATGTTLGVHVPLYGRRSVYTRVDLPARQVSPSDDAAEIRQQFAHDKPWRKGGLWRCCWANDLGLCLHRKGGGPTYAIVASDGKPLSATRELLDAPLGPIYCAGVLVGRLEPGKYGNSFSFGQKSPDWRS